MIDAPPAEPSLLWHSPEPSSLWIEASVPLAGRGDSMWLDPRTGDLVGMGRGPARVRSRPVGGPSIVYLPPRDHLGEGIVERLLEWCAGQPVTLLRHVSPSMPASPDDSLLLDCLAAVVESDWEVLGGAPRDSIALWPLLPGLGDSEEALTVGLETLAASEPIAVVGIVPELSGTARRSLSERFGERVFDALFHSRSPDPRRFAGACRGMGLEFLPPRLLGEGPRRLERRMAAELAVVADLLLALDASPARAQGFYRAARWVESTHHDMAALVREGNLSVVPLLEPEMEALISELGEGARRSSLLETLADRYAVSPSPR